MDLLWLINVRFNFTIQFIFNNIIFDYYFTYLPE